MDVRRLSGRPLVEALRRADGALAQERLPPKAVRRVGRRIDQELAEIEGGARMPRWMPMATFIGGAVLVLLVLSLGSTRRTTGEREPAATIVRGEDCRRASGDPMRLSGRCDVQVGDPAMAIRTVSAELRLRGRTVDVLGGRADFDVDPIHDAPLRVRVPGGEIVVVGTRFDVVVDEEARRGHVTLHEGALRFAHDDGRSSEIVAGERFAFGRRQVARASTTAPPVTAPGPTAAPAPAPSMTPPSAAASPAAPPSASPPARRRGAARPDARASEVDLDEVIATVAAARRAGRYLAAATTLREALARRLDEHAREVLSFELGTILTRHLHAQVDACAHWAEHHRRFGGGRYAKQVARAEAELGCEEDAD